MEAVLDNPITEALQILEEEKSSPLKQRPPGAILPDSEFRHFCTGCDACMIACPLNVIMIDDMEKRYPVIYPETAPCLHCTGYPCIQSCRTGALQRSQDFEDS